MEFKRINLPLFSTVLPPNRRLFLSCRPFGVITFSTGLVGEFCLLAWAVDSSKTRYLKVLEFRSLKIFPPSKYKVAELTSKQRLIPIHSLSMLFKRQISDEGKQIPHLVYQLSLMSKKHELLQNTKN